MTHSVCLCGTNRNSVESTGANCSENRPLSVLFAKFWLEPVALARNFGFSAVEFHRVESLVEVNQARFIEAWNGYFGVEG